MGQRSIQEIRHTHASRDGDGVAIQRVVGMQHAAMYPFLMIDRVEDVCADESALGIKNVTINCLRN